MKSTDQGSFCDFLGDAIFPSYVVISKLLETLQWGNFISDYNFWVPPLIKAPLHYVHSCEGMLIENWKTLFLNPYKKNQCIAGLSKMRQLVLLFFRQMSLISCVNSSAQRETLSCQQSVRPSTHARIKTLRLLTCRVYKTYKVWVMKHRKSIHTQ